MIISAASERKITTLKHRNCGYSSQNNNNCAHVYPWLATRKSLNLV